jgi:hypothetical protein
VQLDGEAVKMTNVERAEVAVEGIVQKGLVDAKVYRRERQKQLARALSASTATRAV